MQYFIIDITVEVMHSLVFFSSTRYTSDSCRYTVQIMAIWIVEHFSFDFVRTPPKIHFCYDWNDGNLFGDLDRSAKGELGCTGHGS